MKRETSQSIPLWLNMQVCVDVYARNTAKNLYEKLPKLKTNNEAQEILRNFLRIALSLRCHAVRKS